MTETFTVWLIKTQKGFLRSPWNPQPPMIFSTEFAAKCHLDGMAIKNSAEVVKGEMIFQEVENLTSKSTSM